MLYLHIHYLNQEGEGKELYTTFYPDTGLLKI